MLLAGFDDLELDLDFEKRCPDMNFAVDWALKNNDYLSIYLVRLVPLVVFTASELVELDLWRVPERGFLGPSLPPSCIN